jgi:hypothetical protein
MTSNSFSHSTFASGKDALPFLLLLGARSLALVPGRLSAADVQKPGFPPEFRIVAQDDCGRPGQEPHLVTGADWTFFAEEEADLQIDDARMRTLRNPL